MRVVGLVSGGKDSTFSLMQCVAAGHEVVALANIEPSGTDEMDSYMYQSIGHEVVGLLGGALGLPLFRQKSKGISLNRDKNYSPTASDEVEDLFELIQTVKTQVKIDAVASGAVLSDYQRTRVENVCNRLGLVSLAYLWRRDQNELFQEIVNSDIHAVLVKVATLGLKPNHLGQTLLEVESVLREANSKYGVSVVGEGGEYETFTLDCPLFHRMISFGKTQNIIHSDDAFAPVAYLKILDASLVLKKWGNSDPMSSLAMRTKNVQEKVKGPLFYVRECLSEPLKFEKDVEPKFSFSQTQHLPEASAGILSKEKAENVSVSNLAQPVMVVDTHDGSAAHVNMATGWCWLTNISDANATNAFLAVKRHLERLKYSVADIVNITLFINNMSEFAAINKAYTNILIENTSPPTRACVETPLPENIAVILEVVAHKNISKVQKVFKRTVARDTIYVQSISHWAPANIGPYSQCVKVGDIIHLSGQIPLVPGTMEVLNQPVFSQCSLTLRHVERVLQASHQDLTLNNILYGICFVVNPDLIKDVKACWKQRVQDSAIPICFIVVRGLPKNAQLEWQTLAYQDKVKISEHNSMRISDYTCSYSRCVTSNNEVAVVLFQVRRSTAQSPKEMHVELGLDLFLQCIRILRGQMSSNTLCVLKIFFKLNSVLAGSVIHECMRLAKDNKVMATIVPTLGFEEVNTVVTVIGVAQ